MTKSNKSAGTPEIAMLHAARLVDVDPALAVEPVLFERTRREVFAQPPDEGYTHQHDDREQRY